MFSITFVSAAEDLSITRIAGLTWDQWNARLAMPLITQLRESPHPLLLPTDLSISTMEKNVSTSSSIASSTDRKSPIFSSPNGSNITSAVTTNPPVSGGVTPSLNNNSNSNSSNLCGMGILSSIGGLGSNNGSGHPCPDCGRIYKLKSSLRNHQKWECGKEPQFQCPFCVYRAKQKMHIGRHMERMHKEKFIKLEEKVFSVEEAANLNHNSF